MVTLGADPTMVSRPRLAPRHLNQRWLRCPSPQGEGLETTRTSRAHVTMVSRPRLAPRHLNQRPVPSAQRGLGLLADLLLADTGGQLDEGQPAAFAGEGVGGVDV